MSYICVSRGFQVLGLALGVVVGVVMVGCGEECAAPGGTGGTGAFGGVGATGGVGGVGATGGVGGVAGTGGVGGVAGTGGVGGVGATGVVGGVAGTGGVGGAGGLGGSGGQPNTAPGYMNLAPTMGAPLDRNGGTTLTPAAPTGWIWYPIDGAICRDGSPTGFFVHYGTAPKLAIYLEGGGACINNDFCIYNPANKDQILTGNGETVIGSAFGSAAGRQQPGVYEGVPHGMHDLTNTANPYKDWSHVYVPYCTGDVHFGTRMDSIVPGVTAPQQFVGYRNMQKFIARIVPTFENEVNQVVLTGASAGSFGAALNFSMVQDAFGSVRVFPILDSGVPFEDSHWPSCMQQQWRTLWGLNDAMPADCAECFQADGGGMIQLADFLLDKHPNARLAVVSGLNDEVIRLFFSPGLENCATITTATPVGITLGQFSPTVYITAAEYEASLRGVKAKYMSTNRMSTYFIGGLIANLHQHTFRNRFYEAAAGGKTIVSFITDYLNDTMQHIE